MLRSVIHATGFKKVFDLFCAGKTEQARELLTSLQDEFLAVHEENEILKKQLGEVARVLDLAETVQFDGQKYWIVEDGEKKGPFCQVCYDREGALVRLQQRDRHWECVGCGGLYMEPKKSKAPAPVRLAGREPARKLIQLFQREPAYYT
jgi:hypothetical protein